MTTNVGARILEARQRCARQHDQAGGAEFIPFVWIAEDRAEQTHHGTTDYALAAWCDWKESRPGPMRRARGVTRYLVPDLRGGRTIATRAMVLEADDGTALNLTGCSWGYGGEGPHGTALVLVDAGFLPDLDSATDFVGRLAAASGWELVHAGGIK